jgi:hypothetical protein
MGDGGGGARFYNILHTPVTRIAYPYWGSLLSSLANVSYFYSFLSMDKTLLCLSFMV